MSLTDKDTMMLKDALKEPEAEEFLKAMIKEVNDLVHWQHWRIMSIIDSMQKSGYTAKPIMTGWSMKRKQNPIGMNFSVPFIVHHK